MAKSETTTADLKTLDLVPGVLEIIKPAEIVSVIGASELTLSDRRIWNRLIQNAFGPDLGKPGKEFRISLAELRELHKGNERLDPSIKRLMRTVVTARYMTEVHRFPLLGENTLYAPDPDREAFPLLGENTVQNMQAGLLEYSVPIRLAKILHNSRVFAKLELQVMNAFQGKYALNLYEHAALKINLDHIWRERFTVADVRDLLGVPKDKLRQFCHLNDRAIKPAVEEVNALAPFNVFVNYIKKGRSVQEIELVWETKPAAERDALANELLKIYNDRREKMRGQVVKLGDHKA